MAQSRRSVVMLALAIALGLRLMEWIVLGGPTGTGTGIGIGTGKATVVSSDCSSDAAKKKTSSSSTPRPRGLRLVLMGDSLTRYSYLSLVYFLRWGTWYDPDWHTPHLVQASSFDNIFHNQTWGEHSWQTNRMLWPNELCDCFRKMPGAVQVNKVVNNRYFYDPAYDNSVVYLDAKGHKGTLHGRIAAQNVSRLLYQQGLAAIKLGPSPVLPPMDKLQRPFAWVHKSWSDAISNYVAQLDPPPNLIILNAGLWPNNFLYQHDLIDDMVRALPSNTKAMWKTTSFGKGGKVLHKSIPETDALLCSKLHSCWNQSWTQHVTAKYYWDDKHFFEPVYRIMNEDLLEQIGSLPEGYQRLDRSVLFQK
ncbi:expressed unknown protein [Seminavis robusta]|uniref:Uncharacterized protein n=1 Tax=Seminavis robusta TaxID=568900 RepID=A0A9N8E0S0_9STRA|nr:expressed unknown protein [Seminavis robusta]|eukprot:Sro434_g142140.1 n/a (363) ;mRNA; f:55325-56413